MTPEAIRHDPPPDSNAGMPADLGNSSIIPGQPEWKKILKNSLSTPKEISHYFNLTEEAAQRICSQYPARIPKPYAELAKVHPEIYRQSVPALEEITDTFGEEDPLHEEPEKQRREGVPAGITHRYPDRVLFLVSNQCAMYCRFCTRKRKVGDPNRPQSRSAIEKGIQYIKTHSEIRDVILSGGDPLMLDDARLEEIIKEVYSITQNRKGIIRIGTRIPCVLPQRITPELCDMLKKYHPLYLNTHFNHPAEITPENEKACNMLADVGIQLGCQTVLLKGVNDNPKIMKELMHKLVFMRVKPYYLYQCDPVKGVNHFRTSVKTGLALYESLRGHTSGLCVPNYVIDAPGGGGKIPLLPEYVQELGDNKVVLRNYERRIFEYIQPV